ncbi:aromatic acid exporter family protein [Exiguobacterium sp. AT1b]|uniref:FUSC family protein n=1 Tax=Exiguobacterium sp. (strain ATCC BAA-1283 / AT1b) TaxID=360911 RepID=UPI00093B7631|nr:aromatic acid exporter family protein [Exiguobacterium sp. AT1b]
MNGKRYIPKIGLRTLKTGIAVSITVAISWYVFGIYSGMGAIAAVVAMQPTVKRSSKIVFSRIFGTVVGLMCGLFIVYLFGVNPISIGLAVIVSLTLNTTFDKTHMSTYAAFAIVMMLENPTSDFFHYAWTRSLLTAVGVFVSLGVNYAFLPPRYEDRLLSEVRKTSSYLFQHWRELVGSPAELLETRARILGHQELHMMLQEDMKVTNVKLKYMTIKQYRLLIHLEDKLVLLLESLAEHREAFLHMSEEERQAFESEFLYLLAHHHDILYTCDKPYSLFRLPHEDLSVSEILHGHLLDYHEQLEAFKHDSKA